MSFDRPKAEYTFELRVLVWRMAALHGASKYSLVLSKVHDEIAKLEPDEEVRLYGAVPYDWRTVKKIIASINDEPVEKIHKLPQELWHLRNDYNDLRTHITEDVIPVRNAIDESLISKHDSEAFKNSDKILSENEMDRIIHRLHYFRYYSTQIETLYEYLIFLEKESNKYINPNLQQQCKRSYEATKRLTHFIEVHADATAYHDDKRGTRYKLVPGGNESRFYRLLTNDDSRGRTEDRFTQKVIKLVDECQAAYKEYRAAVRDNLYT